MRKREKERDTERERKQEMRKQEEKMRKKEREREENKDIKGQREQPSIVLEHCGKSVELRVRLFHGVLIQMWRRIKRQQNIQTSEMTNSYSPKTCSLKLERAKVSLVVSLFLYKSIHECIYFH